MDLDIINLLEDTLSSDNGVLKISSMIVHYLSKRFDSDDESTDMENLMKMVVILWECISTHEYSIAKISTDSQLFSESSLKILLNNEMNSINFMLIASNILESKNSVKRAILLDNILSFIKKDLNYNIHLEALSYKMNNINTNRKKMHAIIERIFALPCSEIENALEYVITNVGFEILGHSLCEPSNSIYFEKCTILNDVICQKMAKSDKSIVNFLIPSFILMLKSSTGKSLCKKCLKNKYFSSSLIIFIENYLKYLDKSIPQKKDYFTDWQMSFIMYMKCNEMSVSDLEILNELKINKNFLENYLTDINIIFM